MAQENGSDPREPMDGPPLGSPPPVSVSAAEAPPTPGATPPLLTVLSGLPAAPGLPAAHYPLRTGGVVIGRSGDADLQLKHPEISRRHCRFDWNGAAFCTIEDLGSRWGTKINGASLAAEVRAPLQPGDRVSIGPVTLYFGYGPPPPEAFGATAGALATGNAHENAPAGRGARVLIGEHEVDVIPLARTTRFGRGDAIDPGRPGTTDVVLSDPAVSRQHATIEHTPAGFEVIDLRSRAGSLVNGRRFEKHRLVIGDQLQMGPFFFRFDGHALERTTGLAGVEIEVRDLQRQVNQTRILQGVSLRVDRGAFVAILGPSGSGKTSLLDALTGLRPADSGAITYDGVDLYRDYEQMRSLLGYVPQDDIVHRELTVTEALLFSAQLRLPGGTPHEEMRKLVEQTIARLGLEKRATLRIAQLSGGQRKRVSVGVELLGRPAVLFLDEPTSGLDPASEFKMMELLRHLADSGCTVVCTTHVMENVFLTDKLFIIAAGRLIFTGGAQEAREHFGVQRLAMLFDRIEERDASEWHADFQRITDGSTPDAPLTIMPPARRRATVKPARPAPALPVLLRRQWAILSADWKNFLILFGQPLIIAVLVAWVTDDVTLSLFFVYLATLWFGCSNAAQEIVREVPIYRRERMVGLGRHSYLLSKFSLLGTLTAIQGIFLYLCLCAVSWLLHPLDADTAIGVERGISGSPIWQMASVFFTAYASAGIGFAISALARSEMQAVMIVPLVLIPQILFSGLVVETNQMSSKAVYEVTTLMPSYAAQTMMDVGAFWHRPIVGGMYNNRKKSGDHLKDLRWRELVSKSADPEHEMGELRGVAASELSRNKTYNRADVGLIGMFKLLAWTLAGYATAWFGVRAKERG